MKNAEKGCILRVPYPHPTRPERPLTPQAVYRLRRAAAGNEGALTLLCSSLQRAAVCRAAGRTALAEVCEAGAQNAFQHLRLLSELLVCCGAGPALFVPKGGHKIWWSASCVPKSQKADVLTRAALQDTLAACAACRALAAVLPPAMQPCAERMLADWQHHADLLRELLLQEGMP